MTFMIWRVFYPFILQVSQPGGKITNWSET